ncbi:MAG: FtsW/RodA/SpoVE family cell cycle protein [Candidatus Levybacteria bacterium]|nr:FtsW/RodA/SpoVE family cell cycle protein [Candidatus Levybacteria bacterium]
MKRIDLILLGSVLFLTIFGLFMIYDASSFVAFRDFSDKYAYVKDQIVWIVLGIFALIFFTNFNYHKFYNLALPLLLISIGLLVMVFKKKNGSVFAFAFYDTWSYSLRARYGNSCDNTGSFC